MNWKKNEQNLRELRNYDKRSHIRIIRILEAEKEEGRTEKAAEEMKAEKAPNVVTHTP